MNVTAADGWTVADDATIESVTITAPDGSARYSLFWDEDRLMVEVTSWDSPRIVSYSTYRYWASTHRLTFEEGDVTTMPGSHSDVVTAVAKQLWDLG